MDKFPSITAAQVVAIVGAVVGLAVAAGLDISQDLQNSIINLVTIVSSALIVGDAGVRIGRNVRRGAEAKAGSVTPTENKVV